MMNIPKTRNTRLLVLLAACTSPLVSGQACTCKWGKPVGDADCTPAGVEKCQNDCVVGTKFVNVNGRGVCTPQCTCSDGAAANGAACAVPKEACVSCDQGFKLNAENRCVDPALKCGDGFQLINKVCKQIPANANKCICPHGTPAVGNACDQDGQTACTECEQAHFEFVPFVNGGKVGDCKSKVSPLCKCTAGKPVAGGRCPVQGQELCENDCNAGHRFVPNDVAAAADVGTCQKNQCTCTNGIAATGVHCQTHGARACKSCNNGFILRAHAAAGVGVGECVPNKPENHNCKCPNGIAAIGLACQTHGAPGCTACNLGFTFRPNVVGGKVGQCQAAALESMPAVGNPQNKAIGAIAEDNENIEEAVEPSTRSSSDVAVLCAASLAAVGLMVVGLRAFVTSQVAPAQAEERALVIADENEA